MPLSGILKVGTSTCEDIDTNNISKFLLSKEKDVNHRLPTTVIDDTLSDGYTGLGSRSLQQSFNLIIFSHGDHSEISKSKFKHC